MDSEELMQELNFNHKWLTDEYKQSAYYREYLRQFFKDLEKTYT